MNPSRKKEMDMKEYHPTLHIEDTENLMKVALGQAPPDIVIIGADVVNVYTGEIIKEQTIAIKEKWIAYVGPHDTVFDDVDCLRISAKGKYAIPGLIDSHTHMAWLIRPDEFLRYAILRGTTTIVTEIMEVYPVAGLTGVMEFLDSILGQPIKIFSTAPAMGSISPQSMGINEADLLEILNHPLVLGLGEIYWQDLMRSPSVFLPEIRSAIQLNKSVEGHSAGAKGRKLQAYTSTGIGSCHEPISQDEAIELMRKGIYVMARHGSIREDLEAIAGVKDKGIELRRLIICTDGVDPHRLIHKGYMDSVVNKAIECGIPPVTAIQCATLNPAEHFGLDRITGGIAPGRCADILILDDISKIKPKWVISNGKVVARDGVLTVEPRRHNFSEKSRNTIHLQGPISKDIFRIRSPKSGGNLLIRVIAMLTELVTEERHLQIKVSHGTVETDPERDILKISAIDRSRPDGKIFNGLIQGFGLSGGAMASSASWDTSDILVIGSNDNDMATALNRIIDLQGGSVVVSEGRVVSELPLPIFGLISELEIERLSNKVKELKAEAKNLGVSFKDPFLSLITLSGSAIPYFRICEEGLVNLKHGKPVGLFL